jgi:osmotically-inducible protein OsmY
MKTSPSTAILTHSFATIRPLVLGAALLGSVLSLSGCFPLAAGGAIMSGFVAADRRSAGTQLEDQNIELKAANQIRINIGERAHINVYSYNRQALITGEVPTAQDKALAEQLVKGVENVSTVLNELAVMGNTSFSDRATDAATSGRVRAAIFDAKDLSNNAFKVVTERGVVYLMGRVTARESKRVTEVTTTTPSVKKVVRVLDVISEEELARIAPPNEVKN